MSKVTTEYSCNNGGLVILLQAVFLTLKLTHAVAWPWWLVLSPIWISFVLLALVLGGLLLLAIIWR